MPNFVKTIQIRQMVIGFILTFLTGVPAVAQPDYSGLVLTESQKNILAKFEERGMSDEKLLVVANSFHQSNTKTGPIERPSYSFHEMITVAQWARGGAISAFAEQAGYTFDQKGYMAECPNIALFNFGRATGTAYMPIDVLIYFNRDMYGLERTYGQERAKFIPLFLAMAKESKMEKYLTPQP